MYYHPAPLQPIPAPAAPLLQPLGGDGTPSWFKLFLLAGVGIVLYAKLTEKKSVRKRSTKRPTGSAGWYALLYNYPSGHKDRRLKVYEGPLATKAAAERVARREASVWYPVVSYRKTRPF
jgi:hypothetical protein